MNVCNVCSLEKERVANVSELCKDFLCFVKSFSYLFKKTKPDVDLHDTETEEKSDPNWWKNSHSILFINDSFTKDKIDHFYLFNLEIAGEFRKRMEEELLLEKSPYWLIAKLLIEKDIIEISLRSLIKKQIENICLDDLALEITGAIKTDSQKSKSSKILTLQKHEKQLLKKIGSLETIINKLEKEIKPFRVRKGQKRQEMKELEKEINSFLTEEHYLKITEKQENKIREAKSIPQFDIITGDIRKIHDQIQKAAEKNIYAFNSWKHYVGWPVFLILASAGIYKIRKIIKMKPKPTANLKEEIQEKFNAWRLNMLLSVAGYVVAFFLFKDAIDKWLRPNIYGWLESDENTTAASVTILLGLLFLADGVITSELKTPLQRLSIKIESANIDEKEKKALLSKTQQSNETFKETLKRFGLLSVAGIAIKLLGDAFEKNVFSLFCYGVPIAFGLWRIWQVSRAIKKIK